MNESQSIDVYRAFGLIRARWYIVVAATVIVMGSAWLYTKQLAEPRYEATARVTYEEPTDNANPTGGALPSSGVTRENIQTLIGSADTNSTIQAAAKKAGMSADQFRKSVVVNPFGDSAIIEFVGHANTADGAAKIANAYADAFVADHHSRAMKSIDALIARDEAEIKSIGKIKADDPQAALLVNLRTKLSDHKTQRQQWGNSLSVSSAANKPLNPVWPRPMMTLAAALLVGLGIGSLLALLTARADRKLHGDEFDDLPMPVLVRIPNSTRAPRNSPLSPAAAEPIIADAFAALGSRMMLEHNGETALIVLVTSARSDEGKSTVASNLSSALAQGGRRVVLVDADMRKPTQDTIFPALQGRPGLSQVLTRAADVEGSLTLIAPNLAAIPSGPRQSNASVLLASLAFRQLIERLGSISDVIVIDAPPVLAVSDALAMSPVASHVLMIARVGASNVAEIEEAHVRLASASGTSQSLVLVGTRRPSGYGYDNESRLVTPQRVAYPPAPSSHPGQGAPQSRSGIPPAADRGQKSA